MRDMRLRDGLSWCRCAGRVVLLDLRADLYLCLPPSAEAAFLAIAAEEEPDQEGRDMLLASNLVVAGPGKPGETEAFPAPAWIEPADSDLVDEEANKPGALLFAHAAMVEIGAMISLRLRNLAWIIDQLATAATPPRPARDDLQNLRIIAAAFERTGLIFPPADRCLVRALALMRLCHRRGLAPSLVFGIRMNPFAAHCWVQHDRRIVVGDHEQARLFTPILVVR